MVEDYIKIRGDAEDTAPFQGIGPGLTTDGGTTITPTPGDADIPQAIWEAQTAIITGEIEYFTQLQTQFRDKESLLGGGKLSDAIGLVKEMGEELLILKILKYLGPKLTALGLGAATISWIGVLVASILDFAIGKAFDALVNLLKEGNKLLDAMMAEDAELLTAERSVTAYDARNTVLERHIRQTEMLLNQLNQAEKEAKEQLLQTNISIDTGNLEEILQEALLSVTYQTDATGKPLLDTEGNPIPLTDDEGNPLYENFLNERLRDLAYNDESVRIGDVEISTRGRYITH